MIFLGHHIPYVGFDYTLVLALCLYLLFGFTITRDRSGGRQTRGEIIARIVLSPFAPLIFFTYLLYVVLFKEPSRR